MAVNCPSCSSPVRRRRRRGLERLLGLMLDARAYRCQNPACRWQGWLRLSRSEVDAALGTTELSEDLWQAFEERVMSEINQDEQQGFDSDPSHHQGPLVGSGRD